MGERREDSLRVIVARILRDHVKQNTRGVTHDPAYYNLLREAPVT